MYTFDSRIRYSECDHEGQLTLNGLLNYFQDCSTFQSEDLGAGVAHLKEQHLVWVLSYWQIEVERYPKLCEQVTVGTFPYEFKSFLGRRNFWMESQGQMIARADSLWSLLNTETMKPTQAPEDLVGRYETRPKLEMEYGSRKITVPEGGVEGTPLTVCRHHLDTNHHVNNGQYITIALSYLPEELSAGGIRRLRAEYRRQAFLNEVFYPYIVKNGNTVIISLRDEEGKPYTNVEFTYESVANVRRE